jgi:hypothetical protein
VTHVEGEEPPGDAVGEPTAAERLRDRTELLLRQVHPNFFQDGEPMNQAFRPTKADEGQLSVDRSSATDAEKSFVRHTETFGLKSVGVWGLLVGEVMDGGLETIQDEFPENPAHCFIDFRGFPAASARESRRF